jgi:hypothetical protein
MNLNSLFILNQDGYMGVHSLLYSMIIENELYDILDKLNIKHYKITPNLKSIGQICKWNNKFDEKQISYKFLHSLAGDCYARYIKPAYKSNSNLFTIDSDDIGLHKPGFYAQYIYDKNNKVSYYIFSGSKYKDFFSSPKSNKNNLWGIGELFGDLMSVFNVILTKTPEHVRSANEFVEKINSAIIENLSDEINPDINIFVGHSLGAVQAQMSMLNSCLNNVIDVNNSYYIGFDSIGCYKLIEKTINYNLNQKNAKKITDDYKNLLHSFANNSLNIYYKVNSFNNFSLQFGNVLALTQKQNHTDYIDKMEEIFNNINFIALEDNGKINILNSVYNFFLFAFHFSFFKSNLQSHNLGQFYQDDLECTLFTTNYKNLDQIFEL